MSEEIALETKLKRVRRDRNRFSDWADKYLFFFLFMIGSTGIVYLKLFSLFPNYVAILYPVLLMLIYILVILNERRFLLREDRASDNAYYLGFLYTLTSLGVALYQFNESDDPTGEIISNFGIALTTTIIGLAARLLLQQLRTDTVEIEREARMHLANAVAEFKSEISESITTFQLFRLEAKQVLEESFRDETKQTSVILRQKLEPIYQRLNEVADNQVSLAKKSSSQLQLVNNAISDITNSATILRQNIGNTLESLNPIGSLETKIATMILSINEFASSLVAQKELHDQMIKENTQALVNLNQITNQILQTQGMTIQRVTQILDEELTALKTARKKAQRELEYSSETTTRVQRALVSLADAVTNNVKGSS